ncbi:hypothetical protein OIU76_023291 [Salix suchowensis]|nr:hypothetical protein OIU76_023291 [Salix suchowensis]
MEGVVAIRIGFSFGGVMEKRLWVDFKIVSWLRRKMVRMRDMCGCLDEDIGIKVMILLQVAYFYDIDGGFLFRAGCRLSMVVWVVKEESGRGISCVAARLSTMTKEDWFALLWFGRA